MTYAQQQLDRQVNLKTGGTGAPSLLDYKPQPITLGGKVKTTLEYVKSNDNSFNVKLPNINTELQQAVDYLRTGRGSMPGFSTCWEEFLRRGSGARQADLHGVT